MKLSSKLIFSLIVGMTMLMSSCFLVPPPPEPTGLTFADERLIGGELHNYLDNPTSALSLLDKSEHPQVFNYLDGLRAFVLGNGMIENINFYDWQYHIIMDDNSRDMFSTLGGHIYITTGLLKYLDNENELLNLMAHEAVYVDKRYNREILVDEFTFLKLFDQRDGGDDEIKAEIWTFLYDNFTYEQNQVSSADSTTVRYICPTPYNPQGYADFISKIGNEPMAWKRRHHNNIATPDRVNYITQLSQDLNCLGTFIRESDYQNFLTYLH